MQIICFDRQVEQRCSGIIRIKKERIIILSLYMHLYSRFDLMHVCILRSQLYASQYVSRRPAPIWAVHVLYPEQSSRCLTALPADASMSQYVPLWFTGRVWTYTAQSFLFQFRPPFFCRRSTINYSHT